MSHALTHPADALGRLLSRLAPVEPEEAGLDEAMGRALAEPLVADRDSPPCDVSAMDGYAARLADFARGRLPVTGEIAIGAPPPRLPPGQALRIVTGAAVPPEAEAVVKREDTVENPDSIELRGDPSAIGAGQHIRRKGENLRTGEVVVQSGTAVSPAVAGALATFGVDRVRVRRRVRVALLVTGDEVADAGASAVAWRIRDANGPALRGFVSGRPWLELTGLIHVPDSRAATIERLSDALRDNDAVLLTGGVSMGDHDYVPEALEQARCETVFHRLPIRPGKPVLGSVGARGQLVLGLPGNPVSVLVGARWFALPLLRKRAGIAPAVPPPGLVRLREHDGRTLPLFWYRLVRMAGPGEAELCPSQGSGDMVSAARADGFVMIPPEQAGEGPWPYYRFPED